MTGFGDENVLDFAQVKHSVQVHMIKPLTKDSTYGLSVPCEQSKNIERLHVYKPSVQSKFLAGQKFVWCCV